jgi:ribosomal protein L22
MFSLNSTRVRCVANTLRGMNVRYAVTAVPRTKVKHTAITLRRISVRCAVTTVSRKDSTHKLTLNNQIATSDKQSLNTECDTNL